MTRSRAFALMTILFCLLLLIAFCCVESATEFSPDTLTFRTVLYLGNVPCWYEEWSTRTLDEIRRDERNKSANRTPRWHYVSGHNVVSRSVKHGEANIALWLFKTGRWDDVIEGSNNGRDIWANIVHLVRRERYDRVGEYLIELSKAHNPEANR